MGKYNVDVIFNDQIKGHAFKKEPLNDLTCIFAASSIFIKYGLERKKGMDPPF